jgi:hypothetical protein
MDTALAFLVQPSELIFHRGLRLPRSVGNAAVLRMFGQHLPVTVCLYPGTTGWISYNASPYAEQKGYRGSAGRFVLYQDEALRRLKALLAGVWPASLFAH